MGCRPSKLEKKSIRWKDSETTSLNVKCSIYHPCMPNAMEILRHLNGDFLPEAVDDCVYMDAVFVYNRRHPVVLMFRSEISYLVEATPVQLLTSWHKFLHCPSYQLRASLSNLQQAHQLITAQFMVSGVDFDMVLTLKRIVPCFYVFRNRSHSLRFIEEEPYKKNRTAFPDGE